MYIIPCIERKEVKMKVPVLLPNIFDHPFTYTSKEKLKIGETTNSLESYAITLLDIDNIIYEYFVNVVRPQVLDTNGGVINVPVRHASPEKWSAIRNDGVYRDKKGQIQRPMIIFTRTSMSRDDSFIHFNKYLSAPFIKKFDSI